MSSLLVSLTLLPVAVFVEARCCTSASHVAHLLLFNVLALNAEKLVLLLDVSDLRGLGVDLCVMQVEDNTLVNYLLVLLLIHDEHAAIGQEHHTLQHIFTALIPTSFLVRDDRASS